MKILLTVLSLTIFISLSAQSKVPAQINLKDGTSINIAHFGQLKCNKDSYGDNYVYIKGKFLGSVTEVKEYNDIEKLVFVDFKAEPNSSTGNEKGTIKVVKKDGVSVDLENAEVFMSCYGVGDKYNVLVVQINNPLTKQTSEKPIPTKDIQSVIFK